MTVIDKKPVPIYEAECFECHSVINFKKSEVDNCFIKCPVCGISLYEFFMVTPLHLVKYEYEVEDADI